jgi:hypothetical protein
MLEVNSNMPARNIPLTTLVIKLALMLLHGLGDVPFKSVEQPT